MILKESENAGRDIKILEGLIVHPGADLRTRRNIEAQIRNLKAGERGESNAAYEMKVYFGESKNWVVIHDLRIEHNGLVAQIDHIVIGRLLDIWVCESKHIQNGVKINEHGEFTTFYDGKPRGIDSPIEQNKRHILILERLFAAGVIKFPKRLGMTIKPRLHSLVLITKGAISRPSKPVPGIEAVIKTEQLHQHVRQENIEPKARDLARIVSVETIEDIGRQLIAQHQSIAFDWHARLGLAPDQRIDTSSPVAEEEVAVAAVAEVAEPKRRAPRPAVPCQACGVAVSSGVRSYCVQNADRFGGNIYCMDCQPSVPSPAANE